MILETTVHSDEKKTVREAVIQTVREVYHILDNAWKKGVQSPNLSTC